jgi:RluA family pseudouridine synthase
LSLYGQSRLIKFVLHKQIIWQDESLLVLNKPAGLLSLPDGYDPLAPHVRSLLEPEFGRIWIVHRLDRDTSGVLILARSAAAHRHLNTQFEQHQVDKRYHALVVGDPGWQQREIELALRPNGDRRHRTVVDPQRGKPSLTRVRVLERFERYTLVEAHLLTGRTHQVRAHLAALGHPLAADLLYGAPGNLLLSELKPGFHPGIKGECAILKRTGLHAFSLVLQHPVSGERMEFRGPYPTDFAGALRQLRRYSSLNSNR